MEKVLQVTGDEFKEVINSTDNIVLVDFWAPWCGPCKMLTPTLESVANESEDVILAKINVDENAEIAASYGVRNIPSVFVFIGGEQVDKFVGVKNKDDILSIVEKNREKADE